MTGEISIRAKFRKTLVPHDDSLSYYKIHKDLQRVRFLQNK
jgi:hypothetical protein